MEKLKRNPFVRYMSLFIKRWFFWVCVALDVLIYILGMVAPTVVIPQIAYWIITTVGVLIVSYQVYREIESRLLSEIESKLPDGHNLPIIVNVALIEGSEYSVSLGRPLLESEPAEPCVEFEFNLRIENLNAFPVDVVLITGELVLKESLHLGPWGELAPLSKAAEKIQYPLRMDAKSIYYCTLSGDAHVISRSDAIFAMQLRQFKTAAKQQLKVTVLIVDTNNAQHTFSEKFEFSVRPVYEAYVEYWKNMNRNDLISLALSEADLVS